MRPALKLTTTQVSRNAGVVELDIIAVRNAKWTILKCIKASAKQKESEMTMRYQDEGTKGVI